jgi:hypothetical protein
LDGSTEQQEFLGQGSLTGVRVGDDRKGLAALNLIVVLHGMRAQRYDLLQALPRRYSTFCVGLRHAEIA